MDALHDGHVSWIFCFRVVLEKGGRSPWTSDLVGVAVGGVAVTCVLWWSYFVHAKPALDHALETSRGVAQSTMARDVFSLLHFPMLCGVIAYAAAMAEAIALPDGPLTTEARLALAASLLLFVGGMAVATKRATGKLPSPRVAITGVTAIALCLLTDVSPTWSFSIAFLGILTLVVWEHRGARPLADA